MDILLVEDDQALCQQLTEALSSWDFNVTKVQDFDGVLQQFLEYKPHVILMDVTLPKFDGFYWTRQIRNYSNVPIVFISSRDNPMDQVMSMEMGADDYIQKPFHMPVLIAKIQAIFRRVYQYSQQERRIVMWQGAVVDWSKGMVTKEQQTIDLSRTESLILEILLRQKNEIVAREVLMSALWDDEAFVNDNTLTVNVNRLRKKLAALGILEVIETKVGKGYIAHDNN
ncbi:response regulator transcription factor [Staphylococcus lutrae]|uniref:Response regulator protein GraR n=1 Tax=Staphylococcus lutrae TaxID=155085 RepID=A0AAC9RUN1_9STAP|nr:response regulator transcription factor [Staphylococcus lutrae]ARJ51205.1 DNA-binding response regulator [Staphylococcus lutrae]PNZ39450.1 DNA-binding response regulator [Staphylococcus lutrae]